MSKLDEWAALADAATTGKWVASYDRDGPFVAVLDGFAWRSVVSVGSSRDDAAFIAEARTALPAAIEALRWVYRWLDHVDQHGVDAVTDLPVLRDGLKEALDV